MRKIAFLLLLLFIGYSTPTSEGAESYASLEHVFNRECFKLKEVKFSGWVKMEEPCCEVFGLKQAASEAYRKMTGEDIDDEDIFDNDSDSATIHGIYAGSNIKVAARSSYLGPEQGYESVISVDITQEGSTENITDTRSSLYGCLRGFGDNPHINICITEYVTGNLDMSDRQIVLDSIFSTLGAKKVEGINDGNLISMCGYSREFPYCIKSGGRDINVNAACRYSTYDNRTYFWLGTPVITSEY